MSKTDHWNDVYSNKSEAELRKKAGLTTKSAVIDIGVSDVSTHGTV